MWDSQHYRPCPRWLTCFSWYAKDKVRQNALRRVFWDFSKKNYLVKKSDFRIMYRKMFLYNKRNRQKLDFVSSFCVFNGANSWFNGATHLRTSQSSGRTSKNHSLTTKTITLAHVLSNMFWPWKCFQKDQPHVVRHVAWGQGWKKMQVAKSTRFGWSGYWID